MEFDARPNLGQNKSTGFLRVGVKMKLTKRAKHLYAVLASIAITTFAAAPAFASEGVEHTAAVDSPVNAPAILLTGAIILALVLLLSTWVSNMLGKRG